MLCKKCNAEISEHAAACPRCGEPQLSPKHRSTYVFLAIFFGALGIHNFYAGRTTPAVIQLILTLITCGSGSVIVFFWVLFDIFFTKKDGAGRPMRPVSVLVIVLPVLFVLVVVGVGLSSTPLPSACWSSCVRFISGGLSCRSSSRRDNFFRREEAKGFVAGEALRGKKVLLILNEGAFGSAGMKCLVSEMEMGDRGCTVTVAEVRNTAPDGDVMEITHKDIDKILAAHPDAKIVAFYDTFPADYRRIGANDKKDVQYFLFSSGSADMGRIAKDIKAGKIIGVIVPRRDSKVKASDRATGPLRDVFEERYILVTKDNLDANGDYFE